MGSSTSVSTDTPIDLSKAKEMLGERWNDELEIQFNVALNGKSSLTLGEWKANFPIIFESVEERNQRLEAEYRALLVQVRMIVLYLVNMVMYSSREAKGMS
jgi:hypothetical protein